MQKYRILLLVSALLLFASCAPKVQKETRFMLGSFCTIQAPGGKEMLAKIGRAMDRMQEIDSKFSSQREGSIVWDFNEKNIPVSDPEVVGLAETSVKMSELTGGAFDITLYGVSQLWNFSGEGEPRLPAKSEIQRALKHTGYGKIYVKDGKLYKKDPELKLDFGGIAQGYGVSEALKVLKAEGVKDALIDVSGDIYALGKLHGKDWRIGLQKPRGEGMMGALEATDMAIVTSGDYERYFIKDGRRYHHILNPATGYPSEGLMSVTTASSDAVMADAMSTALFVMGPEKALAFAEKTKDLDAILVASDGKVTTTSYFRDGIGAAK